MKFFIILFLFLSSTLFATDIEFTKQEKDYLSKKKVLKVHTENNWIPFSFIEDGKPKGYIHDLKEFFAQQTGLELVIEESSYDDAIKNLINGKIDIMFDLGKRVQFQNQLVFNKNQTIFYYEGLISTKGFNDLKSLNGKKVGYIAGLDHYTKDYPNITFIPFDDDKQMIMAIFNKELDAAIDSYVTLKHFLNKMNMIDTVIKLELLKSNINDESFYYHIATQKENKILIDIVNKVMSEKEIKKIQQKWGFISQDNLSANNAVTLTPQEKDFLQKKKLFTVCDRYEHYPLSSSKDGKLIGIAGSVFDIFKKELGVDFQVITPLSNEEFQSNVLSNRCDFISIMKQDFDQFENIKPLKTPIMRQQYVAVGNANVAYIESFDENQNNSFYVKDNIHKQIIEKIYPKLHIALEPNIDNIFKIIKNDTHSFVILPYIVADHLIQKYGSDQFKVVVLFEDIKTTSTIGVNTKLVEPMSSILDKTLLKIGENQLNDIANQYKLKEYTIVNSYEKEFVVAFIVFVLIIIIAHLKNLQINKEKKKYAKAQETLSEYVIFSRTNKNGIIIEVSDAFCKLTGYSKYELIGVTHSILKHPDMQDEVFKDMWSTLKNGKKWVGELKNKAKDGSHYWVEAMMSPEYNEEGELIGYFSIRHDITAKKNFDEQKILMLEQSKMASLGEMIGNIAHQWRQPLSAISTSASGLELKKTLGVMDNNDVQEFIDTTKNTTKFLSDTINTFRDFIKSNKEKKVFIIQNEIEHGLQIVSSSLKNYHIKLIDTIDYNDPISLELVAGELPQVLINIINNAKDALIRVNNNEKWIKIGLEKSDNNKVIITIEDNGGGIPEQILPKIFEPYFTTKHKSQGTGLGLYMSYKIITESLTGNLYVKNTQNGAKFYIELTIN